MVVVIDGTNFVRSIQAANPDGSLTLFCAIEEGLVLRVARGANLVQNLTETFAGIRGGHGPGAGGHRLRTASCARWR